jgi:hypothetical protein
MVFIDSRAAGFYARVVDFVSGHSANRFGWQADQSGYSGDLFLKNVQAGHGWRGFIIYQAKNFG